MKMDNVWAKKRSAADGRTKQNRIAFYLGDDGSDCGGDGDGNSCSAFGVNGSICVIGNAATKSMKTMTTT
jgi:hypothetical protein